MQQVEMPDIGLVDRKLLRSTYKILLVEDDDDVAQTVRDNLGVRGLTSVDVARDTVDADECIRDKQYDAVLTDILFDLMPPSTKRQGDQWLVDNLIYFSGVFCAAVTGKGGLIAGANRQQLTGANIDIITKGTDRELELYDRLEQYADTKIDATKPSIQQSIIQGIAGPQRLRADPIAAAARDLFVEWLMQSPEANVPDIVIGQDYYSPEELAMEVLRGSQVGSETLLLFVNHMRRRLLKGRTI